MDEDCFMENVGKFLNRYGSVSEVNTISWKKNERILPYVVQSDEQKFAVFAFHWKKSIGTNTLIKTEHYITELNCDGALIIGYKFSQNAIDMVNDINHKRKNKILLLEKEEMDEMLRYQAV